MEIQSHTIFLESRQDFHGRLPPHHLGKLFVDLPLAVRGAVSMALRNRSQVQGRRPVWLKESSDIRFAAHGGNGETSLTFELPTLRSAARDLYAQEVMFEQMRPEGTLTGLDLLARAIGDVAAGKADSDAFDHQLLKRLTRLGRFFKNGPFTEFRIVGSDAARQQVTRVNPDICHQTEALYRRTPRPQRVRLVGQLDGIEASTQRFVLVLDGGERIVGIFPDDHAGQMQALWNTRILVSGTAIYRPSGDLLRAEAEDVQSGAGVSALFSRLPTPGHAKLDAGRLHRRQGPRSGMAAIMGKWPGDETDVQIEDDLARIS